MLTPQDVESRVFPKAKKGGYEMKDVDDFLDEVTADYSELFKENAELKRKMKVLADKVTEYQETESAMRATLLAAQKMANQMVDEAEQKKSAVLSEAESVARQRTEELARQIASEEAKLAAAKESVSKFTENIRQLIEKEQEFLDSLPEPEPEIVIPAEPEPEQGVAAEAAGEITDSIRRMLEEEEQTEEDAAEQDDEEVEEDTPTRRLDLHFGPNYEI